MNPGCPGVPVEKGCVPRGAGRDARETELRKAPLPIREAGLSVSEGGIRKKARRRASVSASCIGSGVRSWPGGSQGVNSFDTWPALAPPGRLKPHDQQAFCTPLLSGIRRRIWRETGHQPVTFYFQNIFLKYDSALSGCFLPSTETIQLFRNYNINNVVFYFIWFIEIRITMLWFISNHSRPTDRPKQKPSVLF